jgi:hypothetical protein
MADDGRSAGGREGSRRRQGDRRRPEIYNGQTVVGDRRGGQTGGSTSIGARPAAARARPAAIPAGGGRRPEPGARRVPSSRRAAHLSSQGAVGDEGPPIDFFSSNF